MGGKNVARTIELDGESDARVMELAKERRRSPESLMRDVVLDFVAEEGSRNEADRIARDSLAHYRATGLHATAEEVDAWLAKLEAGEEADPPECHV